MTATFFEYLGWVSLSPNLKESFNKTLLDAEQHRHGIVEIEHLLFALVDDPEGAIALTHMGIDRDDLRADIAQHLKAMPSGAKIDLQELQPARELKKLMAKASDQADHEHDDNIDGGDVIRALADFKAAKNLDFLIQLQNKSAAKDTSQNSTKSTSQNPTQTEPVPPQAGDDTVEKTPPTQNLNFDVDPIRASIEAIMARRRDAEEILFECEWYHLFKSLNMIDEVLEGEEQTHRAKLLARAEQELAERPRCRKAFLYVRHLDQELIRLKGIVDIDWAGEITPDEAVAELARLRALPQDEQAKATADKPQAPQSPRAAIGQQLFDVQVQESEVLALEQKLLRLDRTAGNSKERLKELEGHLESHDTHSKKRENVIGELERYLRSEMQIADARDHRIEELETELLSTKNISDSQAAKTSNLENELSAFKEHAGNREMMIADLEVKLKVEKDSAGSHAEQVRELHATLANEKTRAEEHDKQIEELQKSYEEEQTRATTQEEQVRGLEVNLKSHLEQLQAREEHIKNLKENLTAKDNHMMAREEQVKKLEATLSLQENQGNQYKHDLLTQESNHQTEVKKLLVNLQDQEGQSQLHQQEINALRSQLSSLETRLQDQETAFSVEKVTLADTIDKMQREIEESESLIEIIHAPGEPYRLNADMSNADETLVEIVHRRTIPIPAKPDKA